MKIQNLILFSSGKFISTLLLLLLCFCEKNTCAQDQYQLKTVVIDAGHGGRDPGALGKTSKEKDIVLNISLKLGEYIEKYFPEVKVIYTRKKDVFVPLNTRSAIANKNKADLFISIHANANNNTKIKGTETYTLGLHRTKENLAVAMKENSVMQYEDDWTAKYEGFDPNDPASYIIFNLMQGVNREKSISMAKFTEDQFKNRVGRHSRGVREAGFWVLKQASMPSVLVEVGFISNLSEERFMKSKQGQDYLASAIFRAFRAYKNKLEETSVMVNQQESEKGQTDDAQVAEIEYFVQIRASRSQIPLNSKVFKGIKNIKERKIGDRYKYMVGSTSSYTEIVNLQRELRKKIKDCFTVVFYNGEQISVKKAKKLQGI